MGTRLFGIGLALLVSTTATAAEQPPPPKGGDLRAGVAKVEITNKQVIPANDPLYVKALVLKNDVTTAVLVTLDAVAIGEIGPVGNDYLGKVRARLQKELAVPRSSVIVNASHCHGIVCADVDEKTVEAVKAANANMVPVKVGVGVGSEPRVSENRRLKLKSGKEADVRHAYALPPDDEVAAVGPIDPPDRRPSFGQTRRENPGRSLQFRLPPDHGRPRRRQHRRPRRVRLEGDRE
jgi:hypothetical protein